MEVPNKSASFVVIFVLFCFHLGRICDLCFSQKCWKSFYSQDKNILFSYEIIRGIQQATSISFFPSVGNQSGNLKNTHFAQLSCSLAGPTLTYKQQRNWSFIALFFIHAYRVQQGSVYCNSRISIRDSLERRSNKQT